jgi:hypothetical protein
MRTMALVAVLFLGGFASVASGQASPYYASGDESGNGFVSIPGVFVGPVQGVLLPDLLNGGVQALTYVIPIPNLFVPGDLILHEPVNNPNEPPAEDSDWVRFELDTVNGTSNVVFYSEYGEADLADIGLPSNLQSNWLELVEQPLEGNEGGWNGLVYVPIVDGTHTSGQPGFVPFFAGQFTYNITSDAPVPEPATMTLLALGLGGAALLRRRKR